MNRSMNHLLKKRFILTLALFVSLLPFSFSHGSATAATKIHFQSPQHTLKTDCHGPDVNAHRTDLSRVSPGDCDCCGDHCDSSCTTLSGIAVEYRPQIYAGQMFRSSGGVRPFGPVPPALLRPPRPHA